MNSNYNIENLATLESLEARLKDRFASMEITSQKTTPVVYDTFDWRLYKKGWELLEVGNHYEIMDNTTGETVSTVVSTGKRAKRFSQDFPASVFSGKLAPVIEMRALTPVAGIEKTSQQWRLLNRDEKTVVRMEIVSLGIGPDDVVVSHCRVLPLKGYEKAHKQVETIIAELALTPAPASAIAEWLNRAGLNPGAYSTRIAVTLNPEMPAATAIHRIFENLVTTMTANLSGVREDIDTEFLHDLRVAVRRARSLLSEMKGVWAPQITDTLQTHLKAIGRMTGRVRDLDVYLLREDEYLDRVPEVLKPGVLQLFHTLQHRRCTARRRMIAEMDAAGFRTALTALQDFAADPAAATAGVNGEAPIGPMARAAIYKRYRRIIKKGRRITPVTPDEALHRLRIDCKKLRYLLEFFTPLFPKEAMKVLIKQLKQLQNNLGDFNDLSVQQDFLAGYLASIQVKDTRAVTLAAATGGLIVSLAARQKKVRAVFLDVFDTFAAPENNACFKALFKGDGR